MNNFLGKTAAGGKFGRRTLFALNGGFTVIEILMALAIMSIAFGTIYQSFQQINRSYTTENVKAGVQQGARLAVTRALHQLLPGFVPHRASVAAASELHRLGLAEYPAQHVADLLERGLALHALDAGGHDVHLRVLGVLLERQQ